MSNQQTIFSTYLDRAAMTAGQRPVILFADIDGTLVDHDMIVSSQDRRAIEDFMARGGYFTLATGRGRTNAEYHIHSVPSNFPAIFTNGALLYDRGRDLVIREHRMSTGGLGELIRIMKAFYPDIMIQIYTKDQIWLITDNDEDDPRVVNHHPFVRAEFADLAGMDCNKILFGLADDNCDAGKAIAWDHVKKHLPQLRVVKSQSRYLELTPKDVSKGEMIRFVKAHTDALVAVAGDYYNDLEMMREADRAYTLVSAPREVREAADLIFDSRPGSFISQVLADLLAEIGSDQAVQRPMGGGAGQP